jgi:hypothetical protein
MFGWVELQPHHSASRSGHYQRNGYIYIFLNIYNTPLEHDAGKE